MVHHQERDLITDCSKQAGYVASHSEVFFKVPFVVVPQSRQLLFEGVMTKVIIF